MRCACVVPSAGGPVNPRFGFPGSSLKGADVPARKVGESEGDRRCGWVVLGGQTGQPRDSIVKLTGGDHTTRSRLCLMVPGTKIRAGRVRPPATVVDEMA